MRGKDTPFSQRYARRHQTEMNWRAGRCRTTEYALPQVLQAINGINLIGNILCLAGWLGQSHGKDGGQVLLFHTVERKMLTVACARGQSMPPSALYSEAVASSTLSLIVIETGSICTSSCSI